MVNQNTELPLESYKFITYKNLRINIGSKDGNTEFLLLLMLSFLSIYHNMSHTTNGTDTEVLHRNR